MPGTSRWARFGRAVGAVVIALVLSVTVLALDYVLATSAPAPSVPPLDAQGHYVRTGDFDTHYEQWGGTGTPIVLVHGFVETAQSWRPTAERLARTHRVYAYDVRGYGYTERRGPYTLASDTDQLADFLAALRLSDPVLVGHSSGAAIIGNYARTHPGRAAGVVFMDGDGTPYGVGPGWIHSLLVDPYLTAGLRLVTRHPGLAGSVYRRMCGPGCPPFRADEWIRPLRVKGAEGAFKAILRRPLIGMTYAQVAQITTPALVVVGRDDPSMSLADAEATGRRLHGAAVVVIDRARHLPMLSDPARTAAVLADFARRRVRPGQVRRAESEHELTALGRLTGVFTSGAEFPSVVGAVRVGDDEVQRDPCRQAQGATAIGPDVDPSAGCGLEAAARAGLQPRRPPQAQHRATGAGEVQLDGRGAEPGQAGRAGDKRRRVTYAPDRPVPVAPDTDQVRHRPAQQVAFGGPAAVHRLGREGEQGDRVLEQPPTVGRRGERVVEHVVVLQVGLALPAPGERERRRHVEALPVPAGERDLQPSGPRVLSGQETQQTRCSRTSHGTGRPNRAAGQTGSAAPARARPPPPPPRNQRAPAVTGEREQRHRHRQREGQAQPQDVAAHRVRHRERRRRHGEVGEGEPA